MEKWVGPGSEEEIEEMVQLEAEITVQKEFLRARFNEFKENGKREEDLSNLRVSELSAQLAQG